MVGESVTYDVAMAARLSMGKRVLCSSFWWMSDPLLLMRWRPGWERRFGSSGDQQVRLRLDMLLCVGCPFRGLSNRFFVHLFDSFLFSL